MYEIVYYMYVKFVTKISKLYKKSSKDNIKFELIIYYVFHSHIKTIVSSRKTAVYKRKLFLNFSPTMNPFEY